MAVKKNKRISKGKKGGKKKVGDPFLRKEWFDLKAPSIFSVRNFGKTLVNKSQGTKLSEDFLKGRVYEVNWADLANDEEFGHRKVLLSCEDVQGRNCLTDFHGLDMTRHHLCSLIRKWHSLIEAHADVRTSDGYTLRIFAIGFSQRAKNQVKSTCYLQSSQARAVRKRMVDVMQSVASGCSLKDLVQRKFANNTIEREMARSTSRVAPLQNLFVRKVKVLKKPKFDLSKLMELHGDIVEDSGRKVVEDVTEAAQEVVAAEV